MTTITVREYARLTTKDVEKNTLDEAYIPPTAFEWLCALQAKWGKKEYSFIDLDGAKTVRLNSYVGMLESPCGTRIEILPKTHTHEQDINQTRNLLWEILRIYLGDDTKEAELTYIRCMRKPLSEWLISKFLSELAQLLKKGLHSQYNRVDEERAFIRGQINMPRQMRQPMHRQHLTHVRHNIFSINRPENRLLRTALLRCRKATQDAEHWTLATTLENIMHQVPQSVHVSQDLHLWREARHMTHYSSIKPWCSLILNEEVPTALQDNWQGISLLFPMEKVFECFVVQKLRERLNSGVRLTAQSSREYLCTHDEKKMFNLRPDILLKQGDKRWVLDAKWKCLDPKQDKYGLSQADLYQLFAYGHKYMNGQGNLALIYPQTDVFNGIEIPFSFTPNMHLHILACNLETGEISLPENVQAFPIGN